MEMDEVIELFEERPLKVTGTHRSILVRLIAIARAADDWFNDPQNEEFIEALEDAVGDLRDYE